MSQFDLSGKVALVTGASSGIGQRQAQALAAAGASVVLLGRRQQQLDDTVAMLELRGASAAALAVDLDNREQLTDVATRAALPFGAIDILINAAGVNLRQAVDEITLESWDQTINLNLAVPFFLARELLPGMRNRGWGRIINIASLQSSRAFANGLAYGASKGGIAQLTRAMAETWSAAGINCNAIAPGFFPTGLTASVYQNPVMLDKLAGQTAIGRNGELTDLDGITVFLASAASDYITGQIIHLDGGFTAK
jgi:NAD(P)-dependent dehydrogenase (short-subunit alcohol dehydrogenase family)